MCPFKNNSNITAIDFLKTPHTNNNYNTTIKLNFDIINYLKSLVKDIQIKYLE